MIRSSVVLLLVGNRYRACSPRRQPARVLEGGQGSDGWSVAPEACSAVAVRRGSGYAPERRGRRALTFEQDREPDRALEQRPHRQQLEEGRHRIGTGKRESDDGDDEIPGAAMVAQRPRTEDAEG